ncbi:MAG: hypothetical protein IJM62_01855 [Lachnospiraceae bacterium]|nr:hypothetical protein [Lachnospiraceae bacterium]
MKDKATKILKAVCFCILAVLMTLHITRLFTPKWLNSWDACRVESTFYTLDRDSVDVLFMGSSCGAAGIDPFQLYSEYGISSYNLNADQQTVLGVYYWLREALKTQSPRLVVVEVTAVGIKAAKVDKVARRSYDHMNWGINKIQYALEYHDSGEMEVSLISYLFPLYMYHSRWSELTYEDYEFTYGAMMLQTRGFRPHTDVFKNENPGSPWTGYEGFSPDDDAEAEYIDSNIDALEDIIGLCEEKGIKLLLYKSMDSGWNAGLYNIVKTVADEHGVPYVDMNLTENAADSGIVFGEDANDRRHMNTRGTKKTTAYIGQYINNNYDLPDRRDDEEFSAEMAEEGVQYGFIMENMESRYITDLTEYLENAAGWERYAVIAAGKGFAMEFTEAQKESLKELGIPEEVIAAAEAGDRVVCVFGSTEVPVFASGTENASEASGTLSDGSVYRISTDDEKVSVIVNEKERRVSGSGLNVVIYDTAAGEAADRFRISFNEEDGRIYLDR